MFAILVLLASLWCPLHSQFSNAGEHYSSDHGFEYDEYSPIDSESDESKYSDSDIYNLIFASEELDGKSGESDNDSGEKKKKSKREQKTESKSFPDNEKKPDFKQYKGANLRNIQNGDVYFPGDSGFENHRKVFNGACRAQPALVVVPNTIEDVSIIIKYARANGHKVSKRSGSHSYTCTGLVEGALHINLQKFNEVELVNTQESVTGLAAELGCGGTWGNVLKKIDNGVYSYPHGQCRSVGVGGFLVGGGVNWMGTYNKYGYGAEYILRMDAVLADGSIVVVYPDKTVYREGNRVVKHTQTNNLFFGLRGAGSSLAIVTKFLYRINRAPETRPSIVMVWMETEEDFAALRRASEGTSDYSFMLNQPIAVPGFWRLHGLDFIMAAMPLAMNVLKFTNAKRSYPVQVMVTDIRLGAGKKTDPMPVIHYLRGHGVQVLADTYANFIAFNPIIKLLGWTDVHVTTSIHTLMDKIGGYVYDLIEQEQESWPKNKFGLSSLNFGSLTDHRSYAQEILDNQYVGNRRMKYLRLKNKNCQFCFWMVHYRNRQNQTQQSVLHPISTRTDRHQRFSEEVNFSCMFDREDTQCATLVTDIKNKIANRLNGQDYSKYFNFPSCSQSGTDWKKLYWGENVPQLMSIKKNLDEEDIFTHCQSLTSTDPSCCPFS